MIPHTQTDNRLVVDSEPLDLIVYRADSRLARAVGVMGRRGVPAGSALVFPTDGGRQPVHMLGVRAPIQVWWVRDGLLEQADILEPYTGVGAGRADCVVELPPSVTTPERGARVELDERS